MITDALHAQLIKLQDSRSKGQNDNSHEVLAIFWETEQMLEKELGRVSKAGKVKERLKVAEKLPELAEEFEKEMTEWTLGGAVHGMGNVHLFAQYLQEALQKESK